MNPMTGQSLVRPRAPGRTNTHYYVSMPNVRQDYWMWAWDKMRKFTFLNHDKKFWYPLAHWIIQAHWEITRRFWKA